MKIRSQYRTAVRRGSALGVGLATTALILTASAATAADLDWRNDAVALQAAGARSVPATRIHKLINDETSHILITLDEPATSQTRRKLADNGVTLLSYVGGNTFFAAVDQNRMNGQGLQAAGIASAQSITAAAKTHPAIWNDDMPDWAILGESARAGEPLVAVYAMFHRDVDLADARVIAEQFGGDVRDSVEVVNTLIIELPMSDAKALAAHDAVQWVEPPLPPFSTLNDSNRAATQTNAAHAAPYSLDGSGVTVLVYDGGTASSGHSDFGGRATVRDFSGTHYHATHVAGTIGGDGSESSGQYRGMAPGATIESYGFEYNGSGIFLYSNPGDIEDDYSEAINSYGAVISNNSIGTNTATNGFPCDITGDYGLTAATIDAIVRGDLGAPIRVVWANGNERQSSNCGSTYNTTAPPAGAKNHLTVGAMNSNDNSVTSFTSWGPVDDGRIKPDISAPGCQSNSDGGVTSTDNGSGYLTLCGTSMASPTTAGCAALMLQDYRNTFGGEDYLPSTQKALFVHTALDLQNTGPDYQTGYGLIQIVDAIDFMRTGNFAEGEVSQGQSLGFDVEVAPGQSELRITLAWDDFPATPNIGTALINNLDLVVTGPGGTHYPWTLNPANPSAPAVRNQTDSINNIEQVVVDNPAAGTYSVQVVGTNVPEGPQSFSIVGAGELTGTSIALNSSLPSLVDPETPWTVDIQVNSINESLVPGSVQLNYRFDGGAFIQVPMTNSGGNAWTADIPGARCDDAPEFYISAEGSETGVVYNPAGAPADLYGYAVGTETILFEDDFETNTGWTVANGGGLSDGAWERGVPVNCDRGDPPTDYDGSGQCYLTANDSGDFCNSDVDDGSTTLTSPTLDASSPGAILTYARWYDNVQGASPNADTFVVEISDDNGATWEPLEMVGPSGSETSGGWFVKEWVIADLPNIDNTNQLRVRFTASDLGDGSVVEAAVDAISIKSIDCEDSELLPGDLDGDGDVDADDLFALLGGWGACPGCDGDLDDDGDVDSDDLFILLGNWG